MQPHALPLGLDAERAPVCLSTRLAASSGSLEVVQLVLGRGPAGGIEVDRVLPARVAHAADPVGLAGHVLERRPGLVVVVGEQHGVADGVLPARIGPRSRPSNRPRRPPRRCPSSVGTRSTSEASVALARLGEQDRVRDHQRHADRLLVAVEHLLAQPAVREAQLAVVGGPRDHRARAQRPGVGGSPSAASRRPIFSSTTRCR